MTVKREYLDYVADIQEAVSSILVFTDGMTWEQFAADRKTQYAVVRAFEILGEAAKKVPLSVRKRHAGVPWKLMAGMRDKLIHEYFGVNYHVLWKTVQTDIPSLQPRIAQVLEQESKKARRRR
ncbi:MAG: DUF86 domain-containing protein [Nitrospira sp.]